MNLGETIYRLRTGRGMSQDALAGALDVSRQSVSKWENNAAVPELVRLAKYMDEKNGTDIKKEPATAGRADMYGKLAYTLCEYAKDAVSDAKTQMAVQKFFAFNLPAVKAEKALQEIGLWD